MKNENQTGTGTVGSEFLSFTLGSEEYEHGTHQNCYQTLTVSVGT
jgi:hypothetical protein